MGNFIPVEPEKWAEMVKAAAASDYWRIEAQTDNARWLRTLEENEKLRAEVERLKHQLKLCGEIEVLASVSTGKSILPEIFENKNLKAEVERLTQEYSDATNHYNKLHNNLRAEVERLRKAGDAMCEMLRFDFVTKEWNAAKEGKPSV